MNFAKLFFTVTFAVISIQAHGVEVGSGAEIYNDNCARCHNPRPIQEFTGADWSVIVPHMREKGHLTGEEARVLEKYIQDMLEPSESASQKSESALDELPDGRTLVSRFGCMGCHSFDGSGGSIGPALDNIVAQRGKDFVKAKLKNPQFNNPASAMPRISLSEEQIESIIEYLEK
ncbi:MULTISPECIES: c-type cytochrome [Kangiella]|uniref:Cytochrome c domain-containing protein n=1 Tax=Kangiella koreensis (strain DSM 16069 / JCM 12317 / KCTC 12182 / SW-125) TaxID=523791 RepID=C7RBR2_KANKD|nr:cytochrome c [Kangiella koreensis]ACV26704.1 hypothetical protein Kkor_1288 [Kangiella koreensis DSM 16069]